MYDLYVLLFISPPNSYMHRKCEVPGSKCRFTTRNLFREVKDSIYFPELKIMIYHLQIDQF